MTKVYLAATLVAATILASCKKDPVLEINFCRELEDLDIGYSVYPEDTMYFAPCFNPNNNSEFVYIEKTYEPEYGSRLCKYNLLTNEKSYLSDNIDFNPKWTSKDWIIFNRYNSQIWKIKSNGDSLTPLFTTGTNYYCEISPAGDKIIFKNQVDNYLKLVLSDMEANILDSIPYETFTSGSWSKDGLKITSRKINFPSSFGYYDTLLSHFTDIISSPYNSPVDEIEDTEWFNDSNSILWLGNNKYHVINIETKETYIFSEVCENIYNLYPSFSPDGLNIIWEKNEKEVLNGGSKLNWKAKIIMTDINGKNEQIILPRTN
ncbi:MAG: hypothetical protein ACKVPJ_07265 [Chitinophagales bacterium]